MPRLTVPVCCLMRWLLISSLDYCTLFFHSFTTSLCHALQHWSVAWWDGFRLPHYSTVALLHLYATPYSTRLLPDEMALDSSLDYFTLFFHSFTTSLCHALQHWSVAWWDGFRLPHYSTVALLHLYATPYSTGLLPDEMALDSLFYCSFTTSLCHALQYPSVAWWDGFRLPHYSTVALLHLYSYSTRLLPDEMALDVFFHYSSALLHLPRLTVAWWDGFRLPLMITALLFLHYSTVALLHLYATPYSTLSVAWWD